MGASPYFYFVPYQSNIGAALRQLREREFRAGRFNPVTPFPEFPVVAGEEGNAHSYSNIDAARQDAAEDGTRSILDLDDIAENPDFCVAAPLPADVLIELYGTDKPTREMVEANDGFLEDVERGHGVYIVL